ncbi:hypothetical protein BJF92_11380 [Rhizobium rhizosphaerae]|uniref:Uncharacterized protein n=1 Tax=Xaviernesmea rhizosphaerae TaxID=1672749 RepID=A0A1Q9AMQ9_9HYPH|nr:hypothetical protein BJF92_11380 [Xaviernesmea rhizosphaerae]
MRIDDNTIRLARMENSVTAEFDVNVDPFPIFSDGRLKERPVFQVIRNAFTKADMLLQVAQETIGS